MDCRQMQRDRILVSLHHALCDDTMQRIHHQVTKVPWHEIDEAADFCDLIAAYGKCPGLPGPDKTLDLVSHSTADDCVLTLSHWDVCTTGATASVTQNTFSAVKQDLAKIGVKQIRFLGCMTAKTGRGLDTMNHIWTILDRKIDVYGTTDYLYAADFGPLGFLTNSKLKRADGSKAVLPPFALPPLPGVWRANQAFRIEQVLEAVVGEERRTMTWPRRVLRTGLSAEETRELEAALEPGGCEMPALLTIPSCEYVIPVRDRPDRPERFRRIDSLFGGRMLRVDIGQQDDLSAPAAREVCFRVNPERVDALKQMLDGLSAAS